MKSKYIVPIILVFILLFGNTVSYSRKNEDETMLSTNGRYFEIVAYKYMGGNKPYEYGKPSPLLVCEDGELTFYEFECKDIEGCRQVVPKLDKDGYPIKIQKNDKDILEKLFVTLNPKIVAKIENTKLRINSIALGIFVGTQWNFNIYTKDLVEEFKLRMDASGTDKIYPYGSISIMDDNYNFEVYEYYGVMHQRTRIESLNPDYCDSFNFPGLYKLGEAKYNKSNFGQGYLWGKVDSNQFKIAGRDYEWIMPAFVWGEGGLFVNLLFLTDALFIPYTSDGKTYTIKRLFYGQSRNETVLIELQLTKSSKKAYLNGKEVELSLEPFDTKDAFYVPLLDVCRLLRANCHTSRYDGSILIARFFAPMNE